MARIQHTIDVGVPAHVIYNQLTQFEDYPRFMQDVETVHQVDDTHLHWSAKMSYQPLEWDSEIVEQIPDRCIAWRNDGGPMQTGKVELQPVGDGQVRVTMTVECDPALVPAERSGNPEQMVAQRIEDDLARLKQFVEEAQGGNAGAQAAGESMGKTVGRTAAEQRDSAQSRETTQSPASLSQDADEDAEEGRYSVAAEQSFDQQSDQARRVGQMPLDFSAPVPGETNPADAIADAAKADDRARLRQSIERSVPPSE